MARKKNLKKRLAQHNQKVKTMNDLNDRLNDDIVSEGKVETFEQVEATLAQTENPTPEEAKEAVQQAQTAVDESLQATGDSFDNTDEWQRQNAAEAETDAAVEEEVQAKGNSKAAEDLITSEGKEKTLSQIDLELTADVPEDAEKAKLSEEEAQIAVDESLNATGISFDDTNEWQRQNAAEAETDAAVEEEMHPESEKEDTQTVVSGGEVKTIHQIDEELSPAFSENKAEKKEAEKEAQAAVDESLDATGISFDDTNEWQRQNAAEAETDAAVEEEMIKEAALKAAKDQKAESIVSEGENVTLDQIDLELAQPEEEVPSQAEEAEEEAQAAVDESLDATGISLDDTNEWQRQDTAEAETDAAVEKEVAAEEKPKRHFEKRDLPDYLL